MQIPWKHPRPFPDWEDSAQMHIHLCGMGVTQSSRRLPDSQAAGQPGASLCGSSDLLTGKNPAICPVSNRTHWPLFPRLNMCKLNDPWPKNSYITIILTACSKLTHFRQLCSKCKLSPTGIYFVLITKITKTRNFKIFPCFLPRNDTCPKTLGHEKNSQELSCSKYAW